MLRLLAFAAVFLLIAPQAFAQDPGAAPAETVTLEEGFQPDPFAHELAAGGSVASDAGTNCSYGMVAEAPDLDLYYETSGSSDLYIYAVGDGDTTILVNLPDGSWVCDDDSYGDEDPIVIINGADAGLYDIWVGTYGQDLVDATLFISEVDPR